MFTIYFLAALFLSLAAVPIQDEGINLARPPEINAQQSLTAEEMGSRVSNAQRQKDATELGELCDSIVADLKGSQHDMLPKDLPKKLNRVEKLSKKLRQELTR